MILEKCDISRDISRIVKDRRKKDVQIDEKEELRER